MFKKITSLVSNILESNKHYDEVDSSSEMKVKSELIDLSLKKNIDTFQSLYSIPENIDVKIRHLFIEGLNKKAAVIYISSIVDTKVIEETVLKPLQNNQESNKPITNIITTESIACFEIVEDVLEQINMGNIALFIDGER